MFNKVLSLLFMCALLFSSKAYAQKYQEMIEQNTYSVFEIQKEAETYFEKVGEGKGTGYKQFKRWEYNALREMDEDGYLADPYTYYEAHQRFQRQYRQKLKQQGRAIQGGNTNGNWTELGPTYKNGTSGWNPGVGRITSIAVDENNYNHIIIGANTGGVFKTTDKGQNWEPLTDDFSTMNVSSLAMDPKNSSTYYWGGSYGNVYKSTDAGKTWAAVGKAGGSSIVRILVHPTNTNILFAAGGGFYKSTNGGSSWTKVSTSTYGYDLQFKPGDPTTVYASGYGFYKSTDGGDTFSKIASAGTSVSMIGVSADDPNRVYVLEASSGIFGAFYKSTNSGSSFTKLNHGTKNYFGYSTEADDTRGQAPRDMAITVNPNDADEVHIAGINTWRSLDAGTNFSPTSDWVPGRTVSKNIGYCHADVDIMIFYGNTLYVGTDGGFYIAEDTKNLNKDYYKDLTVGVGARQFYKIGVSQSDPAVVSGGSQDNGTSVMKGANADWYDWLGADGMESFVDWNNPNNLFGTSQNGALYKSTNGGQSYNGITKPAGNGNWVTPFEQDPQVATTIYSGYKQVHKSTNSGGSWTSISQDFGGNLSQLKIAKSNNKVMYASKGSTLYKTTTGSGTWSTVSGFAGSINYISIHPSDPNKIALATTGTGKVYVSTNGGTTWTSYKKNLPSMTAYCVLWDDTATNGLYVGMNYGIYYINDILSEWEPFMTGIPNVKVNELEINFVNKKLYAGTYGRGLWVSDLYNANVAGNDATIASIIEPSYSALCGYTEKKVSPIVEIKNLGNDALTSAQIKVELNGKVIETFNYTGNLSFGKSEQVTLSELTIPAGTNSLKFYTVNPNGKTDENPDNDFITTSVKITDGTAYKLRTKADAYPEQITWEFRNDENVVVEELTDNSAAYPDQDTYHNVCLANDCYTFTIFDSGKDGMQVVVEGEYDLIKEEDEEEIFVGKGKDYTNSNSHQFCVSNIVYDYNVAVTKLTDLPTNQCGGEISSKVTLKNLGVIELTTVDFNIEVNGVVIKTISHTTSLTKGESEEVTLDFNLTTSGENTVIITAVNPNGKTDEETSNNSKEGKATITIGEAYEFYISERSMNDQMSWLLTDAGGKTIESGIAKTGTTKGDLKITDMCLANACYDLTVTDAFSAGGCDADPWSAKIAYQAGNVVSYNGKKYTASYYSQGLNPEDNNAQFGQPWLLPTDCNIVYDNDFYGLRKSGSTQNETQTTVANYVSPKKENICIGDQTITVDFSANKTKGTQCDEITFTANVTGNATSYEWDFGFGQTATGIGPHKAIFTNEGTKTITLTVNGTEVETKTAYITITKNTSIQPAIDIVLTKGANPSCETEELTLSTKETNVENGATYKWFLNQNEIATTSTFVYSQFQDTDKVSVEVTTNSSCLKNAKAMSADYEIKRTKNVIPTIVIETQDLPACSGSPVQFTATGTNGGTSPIYTWFVGTEQAGLGKTLSIDTLQNLENVTCILTSNAICASTQEVVSNKITAQIEVCTATLEKEFENVKVYPNPTNSAVNINLGSLAGQQVKWTLYNTYGQVLHIGNQLITDDFVHSIDMTTMSSGAYFLKVETETNSTVIKIEKK